MRSLILLMAFTLICSVGLAQTQRNASYDKSGIKGNRLYGARYLPTGIEDAPCTEARVHDYFNEFVTRLKPSVITRARRVARSTLNQNLARPSTSASVWLSQIRQDVKAKVKNKDVDLNQMSVEDAVLFMFMLVSEDARKDMKEALEDMNATRLKRSALREATDNLREEICHLIEQREKAKNEGRRL